MYENHLSEISPRLRTIENFLSEKDCDELISFIESQNKLNDRSVFMPNLGLKKDVGKYNAIGITRSNYPDVWNKYFADKTVNGIEPYEVQLNKYEANHFMPPHTDKGPSLHTACVPLQTNSKNNLVFGDPEAYYQNIPLEESDKRGMTKSCPDIKGCAYVFDGLKPIHWVPKINNLRHSAIILFGFPL
tara:strand:- start:498 stop:1061 length:564 start_codon:yes stop_codon:yes gene_type:complete